MFEKLTICRRDKDLEKSPPLLRFTRLVLVEALEAGADKIVLGDPCDCLPRRTMAAEEASNPLWGPAMTRLEELGGHAKQVSIWLRINGAWLEMPGPPWYLVPELVRNLGDLMAPHGPSSLQCDDSESMESVVSIQTMTGPAKVVLKMMLEPNHCYSVTLRKVN